MEAIVEIRKDARFYTRHATYASIEVKFANKAISSMNAMKLLQTGKWVLFATNLGIRIARISFGRIPTEIEAEWIPAAVFINTSDEGEMLHDTRRRKTQTGWAVAWSYSS